MINDLDKAVRVLRRGGVMVFPTDTVWGMGALVSSKEGVEKLYKIKGRERGKPTAILVADVDMANRYGVMGKKARWLASKYWPGALTLVVKAKGNKVLTLVRGGGEKVGLRVAGHERLRRLIVKLGEGIVAGSANFSGKKPPKRKEEISGELLKKVDGVMEGESGAGDASTVVDVTVEPVKMLRKGPVALDID